MERKLSRGVIDVHRVLFDQLFSGVIMKSDPRQIMRDHLGIIRVLIEAARNGDRITREMLNIPELDEFRSGGASSDLLSNLQLAMALKAFATLYGFELPWGDQQAEPEPEAAVSAPRKGSAGTTRSGNAFRRGSIVSKVVEKLGTASQARAMCRQCGSIRELREYLVTHGVPVTIGNLSSILLRVYGIKMSELHGGRPTRKRVKTAAGKKAAKKPSRGQHGKKKTSTSISSQVRAILKDAKGATAMLRKAGSMKALLETLQKQVSGLTKDNFVYILRMWGIKASEVLAVGEGGN